MATIREATQNAMAFAVETLGPERTQNLRLEEVESGSEEGHEVWRITLSMPADSAPAAAVFQAFGGWAKRDYKVFSVVKATGEVIAMRIRELPAAA